MGIKVSDGCEAVWYYHLNRETGEITELLCEKLIKPKGWMRVHLLDRPNKMNSSYSAARYPGEVYQNGVWFRQKDKPKAFELIIDNIVKNNQELFAKRERNIALLEKIREVNE